MSIKTLDTIELKVNNINHINNLIILIKWIYKI